MKNVIRYVIFSNSNYENNCREFCKEKVNLLEIVKSQWQITHTRRDGQATSAHATSSYISAMLEPPGSGGRGRGQEHSARAAIHEMENQNKHNEGRKPTTASRGKVRTVRHARIIAFWREKRACMRRGERWRASVTDKTRDESDRRPERSSVMRRSESSLLDVV